jgi:hypothetical protein
VCYFVARPVQGVGILLPGLVPAALALIFAPGDAAPVAYVAGVAGPLIGADLQHLREIVYDPAEAGQWSRPPAFRRAASAWSLTMIEQRGDREYRRDQPTFHGDDRQQLRSAPQAETRAAF